VENHKNGILKHKQLKNYNLMRLCLFGKLTIGKRKDFTQYRKNNACDKPIMSLTMLTYLTPNVDNLPSSNQT
jgi:hypothetical protein